MDFAHFRMLIHEFFNKDRVIVTEEAPIIILDSKSAVYMAGKVKDNKHKTHINRRVNFARNGEKWKMHKIDWCEGVLKLVGFVTKNVIENDLNTEMKYIMLCLENWQRTLLHEG